MEDLPGNAWWLLRHQEVNHSYYMYGFDRRRGAHPSQYISQSEAWRLRLDMCRKFAERTGGNAHEVVVADKFIFGQILRGLGIPTPRVLGLCSDGALVWYEGGSVHPEPLEALLTREIDGVLKDCSGMQGMGVLLFTVRNGSLTVEGQPTTIEELRDRIKGNWLIQQRLAQHPEMNRLYPRSVNTVRIVTIMQEGGPEIFCCNGRMGSNGRTKDNWSIGGITVAVDAKTGRFGRAGFYKPGYGTRVETHPDTGVRFEGFAVPYWTQATRLVLDVHRMFYGFCTLGWDVAITESGPVIIEANHNWLMTFMQAVHGGLRERYLSMLSSRSAR